MGKTKKRKRETRKRKKTQRGGRPKFIKMYAEHTEDGNVIYRFVYDEFDKDDQKRIFKEDRVYYSVKNDNSLIDEMKNQIDVLNEETRSFFYKKDRPNSSKTDNKTIIIRNKKELDKIEIVQKIIKNMDSVTRASKTNYNGDIPGFIKEYKQFIKDNKDALLEGIVQENTAQEMLNEPAFLNIIGLRYKFISAELPDDLDELKEQMDSPSVSSPVPSPSLTSTSSSPSACPSTVTKSREVSIRLKKLLSTKSK